MAMTVLGKMAYRIAFFIYIFFFPLDFHYKQAYICLHLASTIIMGRLRSCPMPFL